MAGDFRPIAGIRSASCKRSLGGLSTQANAAKLTGEPVLDLRQPPRGWTTLITGVESALNRRDSSTLAVAANADRRGFCSGKMSLDKRDAGIAQLQRMIKPCERLVRPRTVGVDLGPLERASLGMQAR